MLCGLVEPRLLVRMSRMPAHSSTARTGPPAITPVPRADRRRRRRPRRPRRCVADGALLLPPPAGRPQPERSSTLPCLLSDLPLELQSAFARAVRDGFDAPVILITAAVEYDFGDAFFL